MKYLFWLIIPCLALCAGCENESKTRKPIGIDSLKVGSDKDSHGCKSSAGYQWSELLQDCIRVWEVGVAITPVDDTTKAGYIVFKKDSTKVELFLPINNGANVILDIRKSSNGAAVWNVEHDDTFNLKQTNGKWELWKRDKLVFKQR